MADYIITLPNGSTHTIQSGTINNTYDVPLVGQDAINYGDDFATAYMRLLTNFANSSAPSFGTTRVAGQLWYDDTALTGGLNVYDGTGWDRIALESGTVTLTGAQTISGTKTFSTAPDFSDGGGPFTVTSTNQVANLNAELLGDEPKSYYATAVQGAKADAAEVGLGLPASDGYILSSTTGGTRSWVAPTAGTGNIDPADIAGASTPTAMSVLIADDPDDPGQTPYTTSGLTFNGTTNTLSTTTFVGSFTGNATSATTATTAATATTATQITINSTNGNGGDTTMYPVLVAANSAADQIPHLDGGELSYNASSGTLTATAFVGDGSLITDLNMNALGISGTLDVNRGGTGVTTSTGTGSTVRSVSPTFTGTVVIPTINSASGVSIQWNGDTQLATQDHTASGNTAGATVSDGSNTSRNIGFNEMDTTTITTSAGVTLFSQAEAGHSFRSTHTSGEKIYQTEATIVDIPIPNGSMWVVRNFTTSTGTVKIQGGTGSTVRHYNGSGTIVDTSGSGDPFFLARGGVATIVKVADSEYEMWGIGITGGA